MCAKRAACPHLLLLLLSVMGKSLLVTSGATVYLLGTWAWPWLQGQGAGSSLLYCPLPGNRSSAKQVVMVSLQALGGKLRLSSCLEIQTTPMGLEGLHGHLVAGASRCGPSLAPCFISSCQEHGFFNTVFQDAPLQTRIEGLFLAAGIEKKGLFPPRVVGNGPWAMAL